ncbi:hypothetical protein PUN28_017182 [Cardiocondyla obscurior]|uniref:Uncharacterized protein n=1 Tax=Cardiocondyla obscurior TaxID=286306 RepID=A0AAW2EPL0_9HYME
MHGRRRRNFHTRRNSRWRTRRRGRGESGGNYSRGSTHSCAVAHKSDIADVPCRVAGRRRGRGGFIGLVLKKNQDSLRRRRANRRRETEMAGTAAAIAVTKVSEVTPIHIC